MQLTSELLKLICEALCKPHWGSSDYDLNEDRQSFNKEICGVQLY